MDIKKLFNLPIVAPVKTPNRSEKLNRFDPTQDRDANGQEAYQQPQKKKYEPMTDEEFKMALEELKKLPAVKEHHWRVSASKENETRFALIKDNLGKVIRRVPEDELYDLIHSKEGTKGQLLRKTA